MKELIFAFVTTFSCPLFAQEVLSDRWKETQRTDLNKKGVAYSDTLRLLHVTKDEMSIRRGSFLYKGQISNDVLDVGSLMYGIVKNEPDEIQLRDEEYIHVFTREVKDMSAADADAGKAKIDLPAAPVSAIDKSLLKGDWEAYKRSSRSGPLAKVDYKTLIKTLSFKEEKQGDYYGAITTDFIGGAALYFLKEPSGAHLVTEDKSHKEHLLKVWRLTADELVIEDDNGIVYYMKHFR